MSDQFTFKVAHYLLRHQNAESCSHLLQEEKSDEVIVKRAVWSCIQVSEDQINGGKILPFGIRHGSKIGNLDFSLHTKSFD